MACENCSCEKCEKEKKEAETSKKALEIKTEACAYAKNTEQYKRWSSLEDLSLIPLCVSYAILLITGIYGMIQNLPTDGIVAYVFYGAGIGIAGGIIFGSIASKKRRNAYKAGEAGFYRQNPEKAKIVNEFEKAENAV